MAYSEILYDVADGVATVTLNRPDRLNAWTGVMHGEVRAAMRAASDDPAVKVIVLTGAGRGFCAGADMNRLQGIQAGTATATEVEKPFDPAADKDFQTTNSYFPSVPKPIIGAINGACAGLGMVIALYCDIRFASENAVFTTAFSRRGLIAEHGVSWLLPRLVGLPRAADLLFSARRVSAHEAAQMGLVNAAYPAESFHHEVTAYARMLANEVSPRSMAEMKREIWRGLRQSLSEAIADADRDMQASFGSEDFKEGVAHFVEKRAPAFTGR
jgi:enoyl-CoA hydratase/carnithine racemase